MIKLNTYKLYKIILVFTCASTMILVSLLINNYLRMIELKKEHLRINKELQEMQVTYERRLKEFDKNSKRQRAELEQMLKEIMSNK